MNEIFNKYLDPFVNLCHACYGHKFTSVLLVSTMWYDGGESVGTTDMYEKTLELEEKFQMGEVLQYTWSYSVQFGGSHDRILACDVIDLDMMHAVCVGEIGDKPDLPLYPSLHVRSPSIFQVLSTSFIYISSTSFATSTYPLTACWHEKSWSTHDEWARRDVLSSLTRINHIFHFCEHLVRTR